MRHISRAIVLAALCAPAAACGGSGGPPTGTAAPSSPQAIAREGADGVQRVTVDGTDSLQFVPDTVIADVGTIAITMVVTGNIPHTLGIDSLHKDTGFVAGHTSATLTVHISRPGTYTLTCAFHPNMVGTLKVRR